MLKRSHRDFIRDTSDETLNKNSYLYLPSSNAFGAKMDRQKHKRHVLYLNMHMVISFGVHTRYTG